MECVQQSTIEDQRRSLSPSIRNEIVQDLVTHMFSFTNNPDKQFCTKAAKLLVSKYTFMEDLGPKVSGYVSMPQIFTLPYKEDNYRKGYW